VRPGQLGAQGRDLCHGGPDVGAGRCLDLPAEVSHVDGVHGDPLDRGEDALRLELQQMSVDVDCSGLTVIRLP
jgi:hypothetical protein